MVENPKDLHQSLSPQTMVSTDWVDYELLDSGDGQKLERFGPYILIRPEKTASWKPALSKADWLRKADATYHLGIGNQPGRWEFHRPIPLEWEVGYKNLRFQIQLSLSRHIGVFPEQAGYWDWIAEQVKLSGRELRVLNLFGYTGLATLAAAAAGAEVVHVDASSRAVRWAKLNQELSGLQASPIRWLVDDALQFVEREIRRGRQYDGLILDPPKYGHGPDQKVWQFDRFFPNLLEKCRLILSPQPRFVAMTIYAVSVTPLYLHQLLEKMMDSRSGLINTGDIVLMEKNRNRVIKTAQFARWQANS